ncbi:cytochrome b6-f complex iron-sulfur subunit [bacterium BMS3Abin04]|nr:cytochrome b6-f complex iron-sulfur subunit [bacterium BMS3Abin04]
MENNDKKISRRKFLKMISALLAIPSFAVWFETVKTNLKIISKTKKVILPANMNDGISFIENLIVEKSGKGINIFSSTCTHLGCKINQEKNNKFICPCHGSQFALNGEVIKGPATKNLKQFNYSQDKKTGKIIVYVG